MRKQLTLVALWAFGLSVWFVPSGSLPGQEDKKRDKDAKVEKKDEKDAKKDEGPFKHLKYRSIGPAAGGRVSRAVRRARRPAHLLRRHRRPAASGSRPTAASPGSRSSTTSRSRRIGSHRRRAVATRTSSTSAPARPTSAATSPPATASTSPPTPARPGSTSGSRMGQIGTMAVHPTNADVAFAAVLGHAFGPNPERGVYRTTDGGKTWEQVLFKDDDTGASDVVLRPEQPAHPLRRAVAGAPPAVGDDQRRPGQRPVRLARRRRHLEAARAERRERKTERTRTKPQRPAAKASWGKIGVAVAPSDSQRVYALIEAEKGGLFRSDDGGETWELRQRRPRPPPAGLVLLDAHRPPDERRTSSTARRCRCSRASTAARRSSTIEGPAPRRPPRPVDRPEEPEADDRHNDGGVDITTDGGKTWYAPPLPICQFYHISVRQPRRRTASWAACRTSAPRRGPSNSLTAGGIPLGDWHTVGGGEAGYAVADPTDPNIVYAGEYGGYHHPLRPPHPAGPQRQRLPVQPVRASAPAKTEVPLPVDRPDPHLAARPEDGLPRGQRPVPHPRRRPDLGGGQRRPDPQRQAASSSGPAARSPATTPASRSTAPSSPSPSRRSRRASSGPAATTAWSTSRRTTARPGRT